jgi:polysaccharide pyruvyl transferase WcaK-like protein
LNNESRKKVESAALINTGIGRNLGDRAMLISMIIFLRQNGVRTITVPHGLPDHLKTELQVETYPTLYHCASRIKFSQTPSFGKYLSSILGLSFCVVLSLLRLAIRRPLPWSFMEANLVNTLAKVDSVILSGGGYLTDKGKFECQACLLTALLAHFQGKRIFMTGQGIGPFNSRISKKLLKLVANRADFIAVRDTAESANLLKSIGVRTSSTFCLGDDALEIGITAYQEKKKEKTLAIHYRRSSIVGATSTTEHQIRETIACCRDQGWKIRYFIFSSRAYEEIDILREIDPIIDPESDIFQSDDPRKLAAAIGECSFAIGFAYHFIVFCICQNIPVRAIYSNEYYRQKMIGLLDWFGKNDWAIEIGDLNPADLLNAIDSSRSTANLRTPSTYDLARRDLVRQRQKYQEYFGFAEKQHVNVENF